MGVVELLNEVYLIRSHIITYGNAASPEVTERMRAEIERMWNEPGGVMIAKNIQRRIIFQISASCEPSIADIDIISNLDPHNNYFRIEEFASGNISFVDGLGCNSGYFILENLYEGSTTAAHEYGHTLGLDHPLDLDIRGKGVPGIMYPRGTLVDPQYQYEPERPAGTKGGTMHPMYRKVLAKDLSLLNIEQLEFKNNRALLGDFTNVYHEAHRRDMS